MKDVELKKHGRLLAAVNSFTYSAQPFELTL